MSLKETIRGNIDDLEALGLIGARRDDLVGTKELREQLNDGVISDSVEALVDNVLVLLEMGATEMDLSRLTDSVYFGNGKKIANSDPEELAKRLVEFTKRSLKEEGFNEEDLVTDLCIMLGVWARARQMEVVPALRSKLGDVLTEKSKVEQLATQTLQAITEMQGALQGLKVEATFKE